MPKTPVMAELQITQEYLGHSTHLVYLAPMWKELLDADTFARGPARPSRRCSMGRSTATGAPASPASPTPGAIGTGPATTSRRRTGTRTAGWRGTRSSAPTAIADEWIEMTWSHDAASRLDDPRDDARFARGDRRLHDAARPASSDRRRSLRADAGESGSAPARTGRRSTTTAPATQGIGFDRTAAREPRRRAVPLAAARAVGRPRDRPRARCCSGSIACGGITA